MTCNTIVRQEIVGGPLSGLDAITALVSRRTVYMSDLSTFTSDDKSATSMTIELINASSVVVETIEWVTGNGNAVELGKTPLRHDDGVYSVRLTGRIQGVVMTRTIAGLLIDTTAPTITAANTLVPNASGDLTLAYEIEDDQFSDFMMQAVTADGETILEFRDPDPVTGLARKVGVMTLLLGEGVPYSIYGVATDLTGNRKESLLILATGPDKTDPVISIFKYEVIDDTSGKDGFVIRLTFGFSDNIVLAGATAIIRRKGESTILQSVDVLSATDVSFPDVDALGVYTVTVTAVDASGNIATWEGDIAVPAKSNIRVMQVYNVTHEKFTTQLLADNVDKRGEAISFFISIKLKSTDVIVRNSELSTGTYRADPYYIGLHGTTSVLLPDTDYFVRITVKYKSVLQYNSEWSPFRTLPLPTITHKIEAANLKETSATVEYDFVGIVGDNSIYTAQLVKAGTPVSAPVRMGGPSGAELYIDLTPDTAYTVVFSATSDLVTTAITSTHAFKTLAPPNDAEDWWTPGVNVNYRMDDNGFWKMLQIINTSGFTGGNIKFGAVVTYWNDTVEVQNPWGPEDAPEKIGIKLNWPFMPKITDQNARKVAIQKLQDFTGSVLKPEFRTWT